jgi:CheY-like chemotaxis protein
MLAAERGAGLTRQLLAFGRRPPAAAEMLNLNQVIQDMGQIIRVSVNNQIEVECEYAESLGLTRADRGQIEQIILNLVISARDAMPDGGNIRIATADAEVTEAFARSHPTIPPGSYATVSVSDTASGLSGEGNRGVTLGRPGLTLSAIVDMVKEAGGSMWAMSELGRGSTFRLYLPRVQPSAETGALERPALGTETLLIAETEPSLRALACEILQQYGYKVLEAGSCPEAVRKAQEFDGPIHLLLTEVVMPRMSGRELADRVQATRPNLKVLYVSGHTEESIVDHGVLDDPDLFLQKPYAPETLAHKVRRVLDRSEGAAEKQV